MFGIFWTDFGSIILLAVAMPLTVLCAALAIRIYRRSRERYGEENLIDRFSQTPHKAAQTATVTGALLVGGLIVAGLMGPYFPDAPRRVPADNAEVAVVVQDSRGMGTTDYLNRIPAPSKLQFFGNGTCLDAVKYAIQQGIMPAIARNQLAVVLYQGQALALVPLTDAFDFADYQLDTNFKIGAAPYGIGKGADQTQSKNFGKVSNIAVGLRAALEQFDLFGKADAHRIIVLFSKGDDVSSADELQAVIKEITDRKIKLVVIGVGGPPVKIPVFSAENNQYQGWYQFDNGDEPESGLTEDNLQQLASASGGRYVHLDPQHLPDIKWNDSLGAYKLENGRKLLYQWPVGAALAITLLLAVGGLIGRVIGGDRRKGSRSNTGRSQ